MFCEVKTLFKNAGSLIINRVLQFQRRNLSVQGTCDPTATEAPRHKCKRNVGTLKDYPGRGSLV